MISLLAKNITAGYGGVDIINDLMEPMFLVPYSSAHKTLLTTA